jgi:hypothetical protein
MHTYHTHEAARVIVLIEMFRAEATALIIRTARGADIPTQCR